MPQQPKRLAAGTALLVTTLVVLAAAGRIAAFALMPAKPGSTQEIVIEVRRGQGPAEVARALVAQGAISSENLFVWAGRLSRKWKKVKAGEYAVTAGQTPLEILAVLTSGISISHPVTIREGENIYELADDLQAKGLAGRERVLTLCRDRVFMESAGLKAPLPPSLEGYLFPETYFLNKTMTPEDMLRSMVRKFLTVWTDTEDAQARRLGMSRHQIITLASMVEKETGAADERPMIASVFHNRLAKRMRLQSDPTTIYGIWESYKGNLHKADLQAETPYNTYTIPALPMGPIANPGKAALSAALNPAKSDFLFFVSHNDGTHEFTRNFEDHLKAVRRFQLNPRAREGKSWRDLKSAPNASR